jgi:DnaJ-class molecular chaperone
MSEPSDSKPGDEVTPGTPQSGPAICPGCQGTGRLESGLDCPTCAGTGRINALVGDA